MMMTVLDLFAGIGLFSEGLHRAGFETVAACELCPRKRVLLKAMLPAGVPIYHDVTELNGAEVLADVGPIHLVAGSPPCTDLSAANSRGQGIDGEASRLYFEATRLVRELRPVWVFLENSPRLRTGGADRVLAELERAGYACWPLVVGAEHAGAPHERKRSFVLARREGADTDGQGQYDEPEHGQMARLAGQSDDAHGEQQGSIGGLRRGSGAEFGGVVRATGEGADLEDGRWVQRTGRSSIGDGPQIALAAQLPGNPPDPDGAGLAFWESLAGDHGPQLAALERELGPAIHHWAGGLGRYLRVVNGLPDKVARFVVSACGDAVVVEVIEALGLAILAAETERIAA